MWLLIKTCALRRVAVSEEVCHRRWASQLPKAHAKHRVSLFLLPSDLKTELAATMSAHLLPCSYEGQGFTVFTATEKQRRH